MDRKALLCRTLWEHPEATQRELAAALDISLGAANRLVRECAASGYLQMPGEGEPGSYRITQKGRDYLQKFQVDGAVIIAAGFGSRFVPLTFETPKGLLEVFGERMIERQIRQLHEAGITDITIVVGYLKEKFEYLIDRFGVKLLYNKEYSCKNTLATVYHAREILRGRNMYLLSSDNWMRHNMYHAWECGAWYSSVFQEGDTSEWCLNYNKKGKILDVSVGGRDSWVMYGPVFMSASWLDAFLPVLEAYYRLPGTEQMYWEHVYMEVVSGAARHRLAEAGIRQLGRFSLDHWEELKDAMDLYVNRQPADQVYEFENLEELRQFDQRYRDHSNNQAMELISRVFQVPESEIRDIRCLKAGMTNKSFLFQVNGSHYICRIPGPGTGLLINRRQEKAVFDAVKPLGITERILYFDGETGYKIAEYYEGSRNSDPDNLQEVSQCMALLRQLHRSGIQVDHSFDMRERIGFYENLCLAHGGIPFEDYREIRAQMNQLLDMLDQLHRPKVLSHIDSVADNFLFLPSGELRLIDWEYAGMCDPLIDIAMCAIYSYYDEERTDWLIRTYLEREPEPEEQAAVYAYVALGGFLWSLWAVYKSSLGEEFGEYTIRMYRYAKRYFRKIFRKL